MSEGSVTLCHSVIHAPWGLHVSWHVAQGTHAFVCGSCLAWKLAELQVGAAGISRSSLWWAPAPTPCWGVVLEVKSAAAVVGLRSVFAWFSGEPSVPLGFMSPWQVKREAS